jgi:hypothetical protein
MAPTSALGQRISIATQQTGANGIVLENSAASIDTTVYYQTGASASVVANGSASGSALQTKGLLDRIPLPDAPTAPTTTAASSGELKSSASSNLAADATYSTIELTGSSGRLNLNGNILVFSSDDLRLKDNAGVVVNGNATLVITDKLRMEDQSFIELQPNATLTIYVGGSIDVSNSYIGALRADRSKLDSSGTLAYMNPDRIHLFTPSTGVIANVVEQSVINANVYGSRLTLNLNDTSAVYGRVAARFLNMTEQSTIFYDHALDSGCGYTNPESLIYESDGHMKSSVTSLTNLGSASLQALADALAAPISGLFGFLFPSGGGGGGAVSSGPTDPTPRTATVVVNGRVEGNDYAVWESKADGAVVLVRNDGGADDDDDSSVKTKSPGQISVVP